MTLFPLNYLRLAGVAVAAIGLVFMVQTINGWRKDSKRLEFVEAQAAEKVAQAQAALEQAMKNQAAAYAASEGYQRELQNLRDNPVKPRVVRVCLDPAPHGLPAPGAAAGRSDDLHAEAGGVVQPDSGPAPSRDIGGELYALTAEADRCSAALRGLQAWVVATR